MNNNNNDESKSNLLGVMETIVGNGVNDIACTALGCTDTKACGEETGCHLMDNWFVAGLIQEIEDLKQTALDLEQDNESLREIADGDGY